MKKPYEHINWHRKDADKTQHPIMVLKKERERKEKTQQQQQKPS